MADPNKKVQVWSQTITDQTANPINVMNIPEGMTFTAMKFVYPFVDQGTITLNDNTGTYLNAQPTDTNKVVRMQNLSNLHTEDDILQINLGGVDISAFIGAQFTLIVEYIQN